MAAQSPSVYSSPGVDRQQSLPYPGTLATPEAVMLSRARNFLVKFGQFPVDQDFRPELIQRISSMMTELDAQQSLQQEIQKQQAENAALRKENANFRAYFAPRLPMSEPIINASTSNTPSIFQGPSSDTSGKSWDRIVMDLI
ncbi:PHD finger protein [Aspergillus alliaceus]|uniref:PHD finger protein n=1 Tax=Petromyces alliaceus TaxID=209559 RepID=UPI0012A51550|nr:uncharacterized protein BDW43DRAFT_310355 [Aspergillus alliaceus]KAB8234333.1 hypothetical protein BDW43DRAFT_310355 [Aspergillus alliaceus]